MANRKQTSAAASKIAARILATDNPLELYRGRIAVAIQECGLPLSERAVNVFVERVNDALEPLFDDLRTLAGSALSQDETPKANVEAGGMNDDGHA